VFVGGIGYGRMRCWMLDIGYGIYGNEGRYTVLE